MKNVILKYGELEHLQQIVNGHIRFAPSSIYVSMEEKEQKRGQGDCLDGKMIINPLSFSLRQINNKQPFAVLSDVSIVASLENVNKMPIACFSFYDNKDIVLKSGKWYLSIPNEKIKCIRRDFKKATHALIICEPEKFINDIISINNHQIVGGLVHYFDYDILSLQMLSFLSTGSENHCRNTEFALKNSTKYRQLLCKSDYFKFQQEYRFIVLDELITEPIFYNFDFTSRYRIVPIGTLYKQIDLST